MANPLTGDFDAAAQVSPSTINRLLATMHQNDGNDAGLPTAPHRMVTRIGDVPQQQAGTPAGPPIITLNIRGSASVQVGAPTVSFLGGAPRDAELSCWIRARYRPDPGTVPLPEFIHGRIVARFSVQPDSVGGVSGLRATVSPDDAHVTFADSGLSGDALKNVSYVIRSFLRSRLDAFLKLTADLPPGVADLRTMHDSQNRQALALPVMLQGPPPAGDSLGQVFLDGSDFAIGISKDFVLSLIQPQLDAVKASHPTFNVGIKYWGTAHYTVTISKAEATWLADGRIHVAVEGKATTPPWWAPNVSFGASQHLQLKIHFLALDGGPVLSVVPVDEPDVWATCKWHPARGKILSMAKGIVRGQFLSARDTALAQAQPFISQALAKTELLRELLLEVDAAAKLKWDKSGPSADGITLRGRIMLSPRKAPRVEFTEIGDDSGYTAFESWVPGGRIQSYRWTWWRGGEPIPVGSEAPETHVANFADRYVLLEEKLPIIALPPPSSPAAQPWSGPVTTAPTETMAAAPVAVGLFRGTSVAAPVWGHACLAITGQYIDPTSGAWKGAWAQAVVDPALACSFASPDPIRIWHEKPPGHWPVGGEPPPFGLGLNVLLFAHGQREAAAGDSLLVEAIQQTRRPDAGLVVVFATRVGTRGPSPDRAREVQAIQRAVPQAAVVLADRDGEWLRDLDLPADDSRPALRLVDITGRVVWRHDGPADAATVAAALRTRLVASRPPRARLIRQPVRAGSPAPDFAFEVEGRRVRLHRVRGRRVAIAFVTAADAAVGELLDRLSASPDQTDEPRTLVVIVRDGHHSPTEAPRRDLGFDLGMVDDGEGAIGQLYGIQIRPTVMLIDWDGCVTTVQMMSA